MHMLTELIGKSISYLDCTDKTGTFRGILDIKTLEGAGFASQRTTQEDAEWDRKCSRQKASPPLNVSLSSCLPKQQVRRDTLLRQTAILKIFANPSPYFF